MLVLLVALAVGAVVGVGAGLAFGVVGGVLPGLAAVAVVYVLLMRRVNAELRLAMAGVQQAMQRQNVEEAIAKLEAIRARFAPRAFFLSGQGDAQIGALHFIKKDHEKARPYLERAFIRVWEAKMMLAVLMSKKKDSLPAVDALLEKVARYSPKQGLLWSTWAYLHWKAGDVDGAIKLLGRGKEAVGEADQVLAANLLALQNGKKLKMKGYGDPWYQFQLEQHPMIMQQQRGGNARFARR